MWEKFKRLDTDRTIKAMIGMSREEFDALVPAFAAAYREIQQERCRTNEIARLPRGGPRGALNTHEKQLLFVLFYLKTYPTFDVLGFHFDLSAGHAHDYVEFYMGVLQRRLANLNMLPKRTLETVEEFQQIIEKYDEIIADGVEVPCVRPQDEARQKDRYSGKKNAIPLNR